MVHAAERLPRRRVFGIEPHRRFGVPFSTVTGLCFAGGVVFGFGMILAGGCPQRSLVKAGSGDLKAVVTLVVTAIAALMTLRGVFAGWPAKWVSFTRITSAIGEENWIVSSVSRATLTTAAVGAMLAAWPMASQVPPRVCSAILMPPDADPVMPARMLTAIDMLTSGLLGAMPSTASSRSPCASTR